MKSSRLIIDLISVDVFFYLVTRNFFNDYDVIYFCRITVLGNFLLKFLSRKYQNKLIQKVEPFNLKKIRGKNLAILREEMLDKLMRLDDDKLSSKLAVTLGVKNQKVKESLLVYKWKAFYYQCEAIIWSKYENIDVFVEEYFEFPKNICGNVLTYKRKLDYSHIMPRSNYKHDSQYQISSRFKSIFFSLIIYALALIMIPISFFFGNRVLESKSIACQVLRANLDLEEKNDLFWVKNNKVQKDILLIITSKINLVNEAKNMSTIFYSIGLLKYKVKNFYLINTPICIAYLGTFLKFLKLLKLLLAERNLMVFLPEIMKVFTFISIFKAYQVKVFTTLHSFYNAPLLFACDIEQIVYVRSTVSNQGLAHAHISTSADVFFSWGDVTTDTYLRSGAKNTHFINVGFIDGEIAKNESNIGFDIAKLDIEDNKFKLGFFDNSTSFEHTNSANDMSKLVSMLIELLEENSNLIVIYKPKCGDIDDLQKLNIYNKVLPFINSNRFIVLFGFKGYANRPTYVSKYIDLALGYQISSAATETAIVGTPSLHVNFTGVNDHLWQRDNIGIIYNDLTETKEVIKNYILKPNLLNNFPKNHVRGVNHFMDFNARNRMQKYIMALCIGQDLSVKQRIENANKVNDL